MVVRMPIVVVIRASLVIRSSIVITLYYVVLGRSINEDCISIINSDHADIG